MKFWSLTLWLLLIFALQSQHVLLYANTSKEIRRGLVISPEDSHPQLDVISATQYPYGSVGPYDWSFTSVQVPPEAAMLEIKLAKDWDEAAGAQQKQPSPLLCLRRGGPPMPATPLASIDEAAQVAAQLRPDLNGKGACAWFTADQVVNVSSAEAISGTWHVGVFSVPGPNRTQSQMAGQWAFFSIQLDAPAASLEIQVIPRAGAAWQQAEGTTAAQVQPQDDDLGAGLMTFVRQGALPLGKDSELYTRPLPLVEAGLTFIGVNSALNLTEGYNTGSPGGRRPSSGAGGGGTGGEGGGDGRGVGASYDDDDDERSAEAVPARGSQGRTSGAAAAGEGADEGASASAGSKLGRQESLCFQLRWRVLVCPSGLLGEACQWPATSLQRVLPRWPEESSLDASYLPPPPSSTPASASRPPTSLWSSWFTLPLAPSPSPQVGFDDETAPAGVSQAQQQQLPGEAWSFFSLVVPPEASGSVLTVDLEAASVGPGCLVGSRPTLFARVRQVAKDDTAQQERGGGHVELLARLGGPPSPSVYDALARPKEALRRATWISGSGGGRESAGTAYEHTTAAQAPSSREAMRLTMDIIYPAAGTWYFVAHCVGKAPARGNGTSTSTLSATGHHSSTGSIGGGSHRDSSLVPDGTWTEASPMDGAKSSSSSTTSQARGKSSTYLVLQRAARMLPGLLGAAKGKPRAVYRWLASSASSRTSRVPRHAVAAAAAAVPETGRTLRGPLLGRLLQHSARFPGMSARSIRSGRALAGPELDKEGVVEEEEEELDGWGASTATSAGRQGTVRVRVVMHGCPDACSNHGTCAAMPDGSRLHTISYCYCDRTHGGTNCSVQLVSALGESKHWAALVLSNGASVLPAMWCFRHKAYAEWVIYSTSGVASGIYHSCDAGGWCAAAYSTLQFADFFLSFMAVVATCLHVAALEPAPKMTMFVVFMIVASVIACDKATSGMNIVVVALMGGTGLLFGWSLDIGRQRLVSATHHRRPPAHHHHPSYRYLLGWAATRASRAGSAVWSLLRRYKWPYLVAGAVALLAAKLNWLYETAATYWAWHSLWHLSIYTSALLFLCATDVVQAAAHSIDEAEEEEDEHDVLPESPDSTAGIEGVHLTPTPSSRAPPAPPGFSRDDHSGYHHDPAYTVELLDERPATRGAGDSGSRDAAENQALLPR
eukprot:jgi/Mesen1/7836/ME000419S07156